MKMNRMVLFLGLMGLLFIPLTSTWTFAEDEVDSCGLPDIIKAFNVYKQTVDRAQMEKIQSRLNQLGYAPIKVDGVLGKDTRHSLQQFCRAQNVTAKDDTLAEILVELLFKMPVPTSETEMPSASPEVQAVSSKPSDSSKTKDDSAIYYRLSVQDFTELETRDAVLQQLETLKDTEFSTEFTLKAAVEEVLAEVTKLGSEYAGIVLKAAEIPESYRLTDKSFDRLRLANVPEAALEPLQTLKNLPYQDKDKLRKAVEVRFEQLAKPATSDASEEKTESEGSTATDLTAKQTKQIAPPAIDYSKYLTPISGSAEQVTVYQLTNQSFTELTADPNFQVIPAALLEMISKMQDVDYIDRPQFLRAIYGTVEILFRHYRDQVVKAAGDAFWISDLFLENLKTDDVPDYILEAVTPLKGNQYSNKQELKQAIDESLVKLTEKQKFNEFYLVLAQQARQVAPETLDTIRWTGGSCGCSRDLPDDDVYGIYPFWLANEVTVPEGTDPAQAEQELDFSALTRIGYYGVYLDKQGGITKARHWTNAENEVGFVKAIRKYNSKLDLVVYTNAWSSWNEDTVANAAATVAKKLNLILPPSRFEQIKSLLPFTSNTRTTMGDGVTIYFDDYTNPKKLVKRNNITSFINKLYQELQNNSKPLSLNIMINVNWSELGERRELFTEELQKILKRTELDVEPNVDLILVILEEPTTDNKKKLRSKIEDEFKGEDRRTVLRKIVPVISPMGHDKDPKKPYYQFTDDLIYFEDNFAGVGLWPLPPAQDSNAQEVNKLIVEYFKPNADQDFMERMVSLYVPQLCNYACPNRWQFRILFDIMVFVLILVATLSISNCHLREKIKGSPWPVLGLLAATILVFITSLVCDPFWNQRSDDITLSLLITALLFGLWRYVRKVNQGKLP
ncbi:MAG: peptidoglycan-binding domain-containing protein [Pseudomonadota bacterium]